MYELRQDGSRVHIRAAGVTFQDWLTSLENDASAWTKLLAGLAHEATHLELPPLRHDTLQREFEAVCIRNPRLATVAPEPDVFAEHFGAEAVASFGNLGGDSTLIAPCPPGDYGHLLSFLRSAPAEVAQALWSRVSREVSWSLDDDPLWVSTAGMGVYWLHVRLDRRPKYYRYAAYRMDAD